METKLNQRGEYKYHKIILYIYRKQINEAMFNSTLLDCQNIIKTQEDKFLNKSKSAMRILYGLFKAFSEGLPLEYNPQILVELVQDFIGLSVKHKEEPTQVWKMSNILLILFRKLLRIDYLNR